MPEHTEAPTLDPVTEKYHRYREVQRALNRRLTTMVPKAAIKECARTLGLWERGTIAFEQEDDVAVLMDFAIYDYRIRGGTNAVERLVKQAPWPTGTDEQIILDAMLRARFTVLRVLTAVPDVGVRAEDLLYEREFVLTDVGLSKTAPKDQHVAARVLEFPEFQMTTGAALPFDRSMASVLMEGLRRTFPEGLAEMFRRFTPRHHAALTAEIIQLSMEEPEDEVEE